MTAMKLGTVGSVFAMIMVSATALAARSEETAGTFSIVAYDAETEELGVAVESRAFSVGSAVPWAEAGVGAIATQSQTNRSFGPQGLAMMRSGWTAAQSAPRASRRGPGTREPPGRRRGCDGQ